MAEPPPALDRKPALPRKRTRVDLASIVESVDLDGSTFLQRSGVRLFLRVLLVTGLVLAALFANLVYELWAAPRVASSRALDAAFAQQDTAVVARLAAHYRAISEVALLQRSAAWDHFVIGIKELVVTVFLPILTGILGYVFGTRNDAVSQGGEAGEEGQG